MMVKSCLATAKVQIVVVGVGGWVEAWDAHARGAHAPWTPFQPANSFGPIAHIRENASSGVYFVVTGKVECNCIVE